MTEGTNPSAKQTTDLFDAIEKGEADRVRRMIAANPALADAIDESGVSALLSALHHRKDDVVQCLRDGGATVSAFEAAALGEVDRLREVLDEDAALIEARSPGGFSVLHLACAFGRSEAVSILLERGADVEAVADNESKVRPIHNAVASRRLGIVAQILKAGADPSTQQHRGLTPLHAAVKLGNLEITELLLESSADATIQADNGQNALDLAMASGNHELLEMLHT